MWACNFLLGINMIWFGVQLDRNNRNVWIIILGVLFVNHSYTVIQDIRGELHKGIQIWGSGVEYLCGTAWILLRSDRQTFWIALLLGEFVLLVFLWMTRQKIYNILQYGNYPTVAEKQMALMKVEAGTRMLLYSGTNLLVSLLKAEGFQNIRFPMWIFFLPIMIQLMPIVLNVVWRRISLNPIMKYAGILWALSSVCIIVVGKFVWTVLVFLELILLMLVIWPYKGYIRKS